MNEIPLCVDLDGTLILTDVLAESLLLAVSKGPEVVVRVPFWLVQGRAHLKQELTRHVMPDASLLPLNQPLVDYLKEQRLAGRKLILVTAADIRIAREVAERSGLFDEVMASEGVVNLAGRHKAEALVKRFGNGGFDYAGNEHRDLAVWAVARRAIVVSHGTVLARRAAEVCEVEKAFVIPSAGLRGWIRALRVHQWTKNLLLFVPIVFAHMLGNWVKLESVLLAFVVFCLGASSVYILNDLLDLEADRNHHSKNRRPFASGRISARAGVVAMTLLFLFSGALTVLVLPWRLTVVFAGYYLLTLAYSHRLKRIVLVDVFVLASLYVIRIFAGGNAAGVPVSRWLLAFSMFIFLSLALAKRFTELRALLPARAPSIKGRGYRVDDLELVGSMGISSGYIAVLVLAFYVSSPEVAPLYPHPGVLWAACLVIFYWISRVWLFAHRGILHDDPVVFAIKDRVSWLAGLVMVLIGLAALAK